jgi:hypothetical protein
MRADFPESRGILSESPDIRKVLVEPIFGRHRAIRFNPPLIVVLT